MPGFPVGSQPGTPGPAPTQTPSPDPAVEAAANEDPFDALILGARTKSWFQSKAHAGYRSTFLLGPRGEGGPAWTPGPSIYDILYGRFGLRPWGQHPNMGAVNNTGKPPPNPFTGPATPAPPRTPPVMGPATPAPPRTPTPTPSIWGMPDITMPSALKPRWSLLD
jgi:hypothetical protein